MAQAIECPEIIVNEGQLCVRLPGGASVCALPPGLNLPPLELARALMGQANAAMTALQPMFNLVGAILAIKDFAEAVPQLLVNPTALSDAIQSLIEKVDALATLLPPLSVPALVLDLVDAMIVYLQGVADLLDALAAQEARIQAAVAVAENANLDVLRQAAACASEQLAAQLAGIKAGSGPIDQLVELLNALGALVPGMPEIPTLSDLGDSVSGAADQVEEAVKVLVAVRQLIPL